MSDKKSKTKKPTISKQGKFIQERLALINKQKEAEEALLLEQKRKEEEERLAEENAQRLIAEAKAKKKQKEIDRINRQKENGTYLTDKQKKHNQKLELIRKQLTNMNTSIQISESLSDNVEEIKKTYNLRSPIICILGHVDTGKTKLLDYIRQTNIQSAEAGGITQQIGVTNIPIKNHDFPSLIIIDTPGHESFNSLRIRGSNLCDMAILVVDINAGLEKQTIESINILKKYNIPFVIALNKIDSIYQWKSFNEQTNDVKILFNEYFRKIFLQFAENALNITLYSDPQDEFINVVPISAKTGEGVDELLNLISNICPTKPYQLDPICSVLDIKNRKGMGSTLDVILINGIIKVGDDICLSTYNGPLITKVKMLLTPPILHDIRIKSEYINQNELKETQGFILLTSDKIDNVIPGTSIYFNEDGIIKSQNEIDNIYSNIKLDNYGVFLHTSSIGSLEALVSFLRENNIKIGGYKIGPITKSTIQNTAIINEKNMDYNVILVFDLDVSEESHQESKKYNIKIFEADIIYHLFTQFTKYMTEIKEKHKMEALKVINFPCQLEIIPKYIFHKKDPIIIGVKVIDGIAQIGTSLFVKNNNKLITIGKIISIQHNKIDINSIEKGKEICIKIEPDKNNICEIGRDFNNNDMLFSLISQKDIDLLRDNFNNDYKKNKSLIKSIISIIKESLL